MLYTRCRFDSDNDINNATNNAVRKLHNVNDDEDQFNKQNAT